MTGYGGRGEYFEWKKIQKKIVGNGERVFRLKTKRMSKDNENSKPRLQVEEERKTLE